MQFITGCDRVRLVGGVSEDEKLWFDVPTLEIIDKELYEKLQTIECNKYDDIKEAKYKLGDRAKDCIQNYEGKIVGISISIIGDISYCLSPIYDKMARDNNGTWVDESRINIISNEKQEIENTSRRTGGAVPNITMR